MAATTLTDLVAPAQDGSERAQEALLEGLWAEQEHWLTRRYGWALEEGEIRTEFMLGAYRALPYNDGSSDPVQFLAWKGRWAVVDAVDKRKRREQRAQCLDCGATGVRRTRARVWCRSCGSENVGISARFADQFTVQGTDLLELIPDPGSEDIVGRLEADALVGVIRASLSGRQLQLFEELVAGNGPGAGAGSNYIREIADGWDVTPQAVVVYLRRLRKKVALLLEGRDHG